VLSFVLASLLPRRSRPTPPTRKPPERLQLATPDDQARDKLNQPAQSSATAFASATAPAASQDPSVDSASFEVGDVVEVAGSEPGIVLIGASEAIYSEYLAHGRGELRAGRDLFAVGPSEPAEVQATKGD